MSEFHFLRPLWLVALPLVALLPWLLGRWRGSRSNWERSCDPALLQELLVAAGGPSHRAPLVILWLAGILGCLALAGPTWEQQPQPVYGRLHSRVILFDLSRSMGSGDLPPSRLERARFKLNDLVVGGGDREQALVVFGGDAFVVAPLTDDVDTLVNLIPALDTQTVPVQGSRVDRALALALELLERGQARDAEVILIADGLDPGYREDSLSLAAELASRGHRLQVLGVGTVAGRPVSLPGGGFLTDERGNIVVPGLDRSGLSALAARGGGRYEDMRSDNADVARLNQPRQDFGRGIRDAAHAGDRSLWIDRGVWLLIPILLLGSLAFRRGWLLLLPMVLLPLPQPAMALDWDDLWTRPDQRAAEALARDTPEAVPESAAVHWRAVAAYRQGEYEEAIRLGDGAQAAVDHYNLGNAQARSGDLASAAASYRQALELAPDMADARFNLELVEQAQEREQPQQDTSGEPQDNEGDESQQGADSDAQNGQGEGGESGEPFPQSEGSPDPGSSETAESAESAEPAEFGSEENGQDNTETAETAGDDETGSDTENQSPDLAAEGGQGLESLSEREQQQAMAQWLRQVPDDPGGLLRRKFHYQYGRRDDPQRGGQAW
jgi:Ca-activated chloride channel family protein